MRSWRSGIKALGLGLAAALSLMALSAAGAQASGEFFIGTETEDVLFEDIPIAEETIEGEVHGGAVLLVPNLGIEIGCGGAQVNGVIYAGGNTSTVILAEECELLGLGQCEIYPTAADLEAETNQGHITPTTNGLVVLHNGAHYLRVSGLGGNEIFTIVYFHGSECALAGLEVEFGGSTAFLLPTALELEQDQILRPLLDSQIPHLVLSLGSRLRFGGEQAEIHGNDVLAYLAGTFANEPWGAQ